MPSTVAAMVAEQGLPPTLTQFLNESLGIRTAAAFLKLQELQGGAWRMEGSASGMTHGRLLSSSEEQRAARVFLYPDTTGVFIPEIFELFRGPPLKAGKMVRPDKAEDGEAVYPIFSFDHALQVIFYDELRHANVTSPESADLFVRLNAVAAPPLKPLDFNPTRQAVTSWLEARNATFRTATARDGGRRSERLRLRAAELGCDAPSPIASGSDELDQLQSMLRCIVRRQLVAEMCARAGPDAAISDLRHLSASTLHRHFVFSTSGCGLGAFLDDVYNSPLRTGACHMFACEKFELGRAACWRRGPLATLLRWDVPAFGEHAHGRRPMELNVPSPSSIRWSARLDALGLQPPWRSALTHPHERTLLYAFVGTNGTATKGHVIANCRASPSCGLLEYEAGRYPHITESYDDRGVLAFYRRDRASGALRRREAGGDSPQEVALPFETVTAVMALKRRSLFCIEPEGLYPGRKSQVDAILSGCIPVFLFDESNLETLLPLHFRWWRHASIALTQHQRRGLADGSFDLEAFLKGVNASGAAARMQRAIAKHAHQLVYSIDGSPLADGAVTRTMNGLLRQVEALLAPRRGEAEEDRERHRRGGEFLTPRQEEDRPTDREVLEAWWAESRSR